MKVVMYCKDNDITRIAIDYLKLKFDDVIVNPEIVEECDYLLSFINGRIFKKKELAKVKYEAINWHTAPPKYPGTGGYSRAFLNKDIRFGITCHHMDSKIDHGNIIDVRYFDIGHADTVNKLLRLTHIKALEHFIYFVRRGMIEVMEWESEIDYKRASMIEINKKLPPEVLE